MGGRFRLSRGRGASRRTRPVLVELEPRRLLAAGDVLTYHGDLASTGQNLAETFLTTANVAVASFGKRFTTALDGEVYAQPLFVSFVVTTSGQDQGVHDVVYVATEHDSLYALDAGSGEILWKTSFLDPASNATTVPSSDTGTGDLTPEIGITSTPVIDPATRLLYLVAKTKQVEAGVAHYVLTIHTINIANGAEGPAGPVVIADTSFDGNNYTYFSGPSVAGTGDGSVGGKVNFNALRQHQRAGLSLVNGTLYIASASHGDNDPYHGWILGYNAATLAPSAVFCTTPNGSRGGIWQGGGRIASDSQGDLYVETGNGTFDETPDANGFPVRGDYGDSVVKLAPDPSTSAAKPNINGWGLKVVDYFTPSDQQYLEAVDLDLGSGGSMILPDSAGSPTHPHLMVASGKEGNVYLIDRDQMGHFDLNADHVVQELVHTLNGAFDTPAYFNGSIYYGAIYDAAKQYTISAGALSSSPVSVSTQGLGFPGATPTISSDGAGGGGIVWMLDHDSSQLRAVDAANLANLLYTSDMAPGGRDQLGQGIKFTVPTVANGMVFAGTADSLVGYGLFLPTVVSPTASPATISAVEGAAFSGKVATFTTTGSATAPLVASVDWNDGTPATAATIQADPSGGFDVLGTHTYADEGIHNARIKILGPGGARASVLSPVNVDDDVVSASSGNFAPVEGQSFSGAVAHFTDKDTGAPLTDFSATVDWGDGSITGGTITVDPAGGYLVAGTHTYLDEGQHQVNVVVDDVGGSASQTSTPITVADASLALTLVPFTPTEGIPVSGVIATFTDANAGAKTGDFAATITWGDGSSPAPAQVTSGVGGGFVISATHRYEDGTHPFKVSLADVGGSTAAQSATVVVADAALTELPVPITATEGTTYNGVVGRFIDGNPSATAGDFTATIDWGDNTSSLDPAVTFVGGQFQVSGSHPFEEGTNIPVNVTVTDSGGSSVVIGSSANIADAPLLVTPTTFSASEGTAFSGAVAHFADLDASAPQSDYTGTINWGDGSSPTLIKVVANTSIGGYDVFPQSPLGDLGSHTFDEGSGTVVVTVNDDGGSTATTSYGLTVPDAALTAAPAPVTATEGVAFNGPVAIVTDANSNALQGDFAATINWGDKTTDAGMVTALGSGRFQVSGSHSHTFEEGTYGVGVTITDVGSSTATNVTVTVPDSPLVVTPVTVAASEGTPITSVLATFTDGNPAAQTGDFTATIDWRDGTTATGTIAPQAGGGFAITGSHVFEEGKYAVAVSVQDIGGSTASTIVTVNLPDADLSASNLPAIAATEGVPLTATVADFTDKNPSAKASDFTAVIDWGDKSATSLGTVAADGSNGFKVTGGHLYEEGSFTATVTITDVGGSTASSTVAVTVPDAPLALAVVPFAPQEGILFSGPVATFTDTDPTAPIGDFAATITWEPGQTTAGTVTSLGGGKFTISGTYTYLDEESPSVSVSLTDVGGKATSAHAGISVQDAPLTASGLILTPTEKVGFSGTVATFQDANASADPSDFTASINWGDGLTTVGAVTPQGGGGFNVGGTHTYATSATYTLHITVNDKGGSTATPASAAAVADLLFPLTGALNPASISGSANGASVTSVQQPNFNGTAEPGAIVSLFAQRSDSLSPVLVGQTKANAAGAWSITTVPLSGGAFTITASATEANGKPSSSLTTLFPTGSNGPLVIDTTPPRVANVNLNPSRGQFTITFQDALDGLVTADLLNGANYALSLPSGRTARRFSLRSLALSPSDPNTVLATFNVGRRMRPGGYVLTINAQGVTDLAGNHLDERVYTPFPSVNPPPGSNYVALITTDGRTASGPQVYVPFSQIAAANRHARFIRGRVGVRRR